MKNLAGQSFFEVVVAVGLMSIVLITLVAMGSASIRASVYSRNQTGATRYSQQAFEWLREEKDASWTNFKTKALTLNWCLDSLAWLKPGSCSVTDIISGTIFTRALKFTNIDVNTIQADVTTTWVDAQGTHSIPTSTVFTNWGGFIVQATATPGPTGTPGPTSTPVPTPTPIPAPIAWWKFDEGSGSSVSDSSGSGFTGTWFGSGASHWAAGKSGTGGNFSSTDDNVKVTDNTAFNSAGTRTVAMWVNRRVLTTNLPRIINQYTDANNYWALTIPQTSGVSDTNAVVLSVKVAGTQIDRKTPDGTLSTAGAWYHVVAEFTGTTIQAIYVNNVSQALSTVVNIYTFGVPTGLFIGNRDDALRGFDGQIDDVRIFNYTLTPAQISYVYNNP